MEGNENRHDAGLQSFKQKVWIATGIVTLTVCLLLILKTVVNALLLLLAGTLIAVYFRGLSHYLHNKAHIPIKWSLAISIGGTIILIGLLFFFIGTKVQAQIQELSDKMPSSVSQAKEKISQYPAGERIVSAIEQGKGKTKKIVSTAGGLFRTTFGALGDVYIILFLGIYFTANPGLYKKGIIKLVPVHARDDADHLLNKTGTTLRNWLIGKIFAMIVVAVLTAIGLYIVGMPMALALALIAGILNFIPNFGPIIAMIPAVLIAFMQGTNTALIVAGMYILIQILESNIITPMVQNKLVQIPPAMIITAQVIMGVLTGGIGLLLATPIVAIVMVFVNELYVKPQEQKANNKNNSGDTNTDK